MYNKELFEEYAELKTKISSLEEEASKLKVKIEENMIEMNIEEIPLETGTISMMSGKKKWVYPEEIKKAEESLEEKKKEAQQLGTATIIEGKPFVQFNQKKKNGNN